MNKIYLITLLVIIFEKIVSQGQTFYDKCLCPSTEFLDDQDTCVSNSDDHGIGNCAEYDYNRQNSTLYCKECDTNYALSKNEQSCHQIDFAGNSPTRVPDCKTYVFDNSTSQWECKECETNFTLNSVTKLECVDTPVLGDNQHVHFCVDYDYNGTDFKCLLCEPYWMTPDQPGWGWLYYAQFDGCEHFPLDGQPGYVQNCDVYENEPFVLGTGWSCIKCQDDNVLNQQTLQECAPAPTGGDVIQDCEVYKMESTGVYLCEKCGASAPYLRDGTECLNQAAISNCVSYTSSPNTCVKCDENYYLDNNQCVQCFQSNTTTPGTNTTTPGTNTTTPGTNTTTPGTNTTTPGTNTTTPSTNTTTIPSTNTTTTPPINTNSTVGTNSTSTPTLNTNQSSLTNKTSGTQLIGKISNQTQEQLEEIPSGCQILKVAFGAISLFIMLV